jgi:16S rRNA (adenine1518-N6/adenine1519-N6)-dimethyltransferase
MHTPRKRFGQHFLHDDDIIARIIASIAPAPADRLVEIGPGQGALTFPMLKQVQQLEVVELDRDLIPILERRAAAIGQLHIHQGDVLDFDFAALKTDDRLLRVFGNLPYNISSPLIFHLLSYSGIIGDMVFMLQKEVAERLAAPADSEHYGRLSVMVQYHCQVELLFDVPPEAFTPPPKVDSSIVRLVPYVKYPVRAEDYKQFAAVVKCAFSQRRKTLRNSLKSMMDDAAWERILIKSNLRAEDLTVSEFVALSNAMSRKQ